MVSPPVSDWLRVAGFLVLGAGAGLLNLALFHAISRSYQADAAGTVNRGGIWYGLGCLAATLLVAGTFYAYTVPSILIFMAVVPGILRRDLRAHGAIPTPPRARIPRMRQALQDFRSPGAVLFALLLFVQFGNEWSIAGWLPLFLIRRVGLSPSSSLMILALYWVFLMTGRLVAVAILPRVRHGRLLMGSVLSAHLRLPDAVHDRTTGLARRSGAVLRGRGLRQHLSAGGGGDRPAISLLPSRLLQRHLLVCAGGRTAGSGHAGYAASSWGVGVVMGIPLIGTFMVMALLMLIWLESKVTGR